MPKKKTARKKTTKKKATRKKAATTTPKRIPRKKGPTRPPDEALEVKKERDRVRRRASYKRKKDLAAKVAEGKDAREKSSKLLRVVNSKRGVNGRPPFEPTLDDRQRVETLSGLGLKEEDICLLVKNPSTGKAIGLDTLKRYFQDELDRGAPLLHAKIAQSLVKKALGNGPQAVTAGIWVSKCRMGWKERVAVEVEVKSGVLIAPAAVTPDEWVKQAAARTADKPEPGTEV